MFYSSVGFSSFEKLLIFLQTQLDIITKLLLFSLLKRIILIINFKSEKMCSLPPPTANK
jgi:hypothetical protein